MTDKGKILDMQGKMINKGFRSAGKENKTERLEKLENYIKYLEQSIERLVQESFAHNANGMVLFRVLEEKGLLTEEDIEKGWDKYVTKPYEDAAKAQATEPENKKEDSKDK